jgi:1-acyl-sn-glycerol-3-phosphate acyltransferase
VDKPGPYLRFCVVVLYPLVSLAWRLRYRGIERIPSSGPAIIAANHISHADPLVIARFIWDAGRLPRFLAKASLFTVPVVGRFIDKTGQIPVHRGTADAEASLRGAVEALRRGEVVLIYPEGTVTRDPDGWPMQAKTGVARLALLVPEAQVIPVGQWGAREFLDVYHRRFRPLPRKTVGVSAGRALDLTAWYGRPARGETLRGLTDEIMRAVRHEVAILREENPPDAFYVRPDGVRARGSQPAPAPRSPSQGDGS